MEEGKEIEQPNGVLQAKLNELYEAIPEEIEFNGKKHKIGWLHNYTVRRFTNVMATEKNPHKANCKLASIILLNDMWMIRFFYWIVWRWNYYVKDMDDVEILKILDVAKKKVQHEAFYLITIFSTEMTDLMMTMTKEEVNHIQAAQRGGRRTA